MHIFFSTPLFLGYCFGALAFLFSNSSYALPKNSIEINSTSHPQEDGSQAHPIHIKHGEPLQLNVVIFVSHPDLNMHKIKISSISNENFQYAPYMDTVCIIDEHDRYPCRGQIFLKYIGGNLQQQQPVTLTFTTFENSGEQKTFSPLHIEAPLYLVVDE